MEISFDAITFAHLAAVIVGVVSSAVILYFGFKTNPVNQPLGIGQLSISLGIFVSFSIVSQLIVHWPFLYRLGNVFVLIFIPMPYLYTVFYTQKRLWRWYDLLHLIPLLIYLVDYWDTLSLSSAQKTELILQEINDLDLLGKFSQGRFIGPGFHTEFRTVLFSGYWVAQVVILFRWVKSHSLLTPENKVWKNWMILFLGCQFFLWFPFFLTVFWLDKSTTYFITNSFSVGWVMLSSLFLFFFPSLLYGKPFEGGDRISKFTKALKKTPISDEDEKRLEEVMRSIETHMADNRLFLKPGYTINDFSKEIHIPVYQISKSLNTFQDLSFIDFINKNRVQYCVQKLEKGEWSNFTIEAVAHECGFNNRNSFTNAFKKFLGTSPSEYRENFHKS
ncbi:helix-turn-helix domain-containing protein [Cognataquiflexum rubidum]|uniref:helix-turn-helix domain-containing protein n=1 Tax=Cognataquiflexum rubidum TaxID=2922273 RepID=UPI001F13F039|nr:helix-turn-helix transcriptional regulator [Cognataquiflexum rubidum]MCH6233612.1 helix-turn-helix transcriptional regulator [Cognataquiflexum rubidum]